MNQRNLSKKDNKKRIKKVLKLNKIKKEFDNPKIVYSEIKEEISYYLWKEDYKSSADLIRKISKAIKNGLNNSSKSLKSMFDEIAQIVILMHQCVKIISKNKDVSEQEIKILQKDIELIENLVKWVENCPILDLNNKNSIAINKKTPKMLKH